MIGVYIGVPLAFLMIILGIINYRKNKQQLEAINAILVAYGELKDDMYTIRGQTFQIHYFRLGYHQELTLNSEIVWEVNHGGKSTLIRQDHLKNDQEKIIIVYPSNEPIKRYINENEMVFVTPSNHFHHKRIIRLSDLENWLKEF